MTSTDPAPTSDRADSPPAEAEPSFRLVIEQLQLEGEYPAAADAAARRRTMANARPTPPYPSTRKPRVDMLARQRAVSGWKPRGDLSKVADEQGFDSLPGLLVALSDSAAASIELQERRQRMVEALGLDRDQPGSREAPPVP